MSQRDYATFDTEEAVVVLSHYDLGVIESLTEFPRGSRKSPKIGVVTERGKYLLKRRAPKRSNLDRVRFAHRVQRHLEASGFPVARLLPTRAGRETWVVLRGKVYEVFEFVPGQPYRRTPGEARQAGATLARFHAAMRGFTVPSLLPVPSGDYHDHPALRRGLDSLEENLISHDSLAGDFAALASLLTFLREAYDSAVGQVRKAGLERWPQCIIHGDWHSGNLLFRHEQVAAVIDFDSSRLSRRVIDIANGALQFSMVGAGDPAGWPEYLDMSRWHAFLSGYSDVEAMAPEEAACLPDLAVEALIAECVPAIQETGSLGRWPGYRVLQMVRRKTEWIQGHRGVFQPPPVDEGRAAGPPTGIPPDFA